MRRNSRIIRMSLAMLLMITAGLLSYIFWRPAGGDGVAPDTAIPATLPSPPSQQLVPLSDPVNAPLRFVYIVSVLLVFVSAALVLFRLVSKHFFKDTQ
ncbi:MAG TPA: hypothetical protein PLH19_10720 [Anaerolineae bacterium]|nr:hypothetical protein [Anaerolineae bacterium]HQH38990.1 hypothetical protein [Anaerolineae bacterium]